MNPIPKLLTNDMNAQLLQDFMEWEVQASLKQMAPLKAPCPDGRPPFFYLNYWNLIGYDITKTILSYLNTSTLPHPINHTFITLIPKIKNPQFVSNYHPISLCNVLYNFFSNVLTNRLKIFFTSHNYKTPKCVHKKLPNL